MKGYQVQTLKFEHPITICDGEVLEIVVLSEQLARVTVTHDESGVPVSTELKMEMTP